MSGNYAPTRDSKIDARWDTVMLSTRDLGAVIPINFVTWPGISLTKSCFADKQYTWDKRVCISNLLELGFTRYEVDLYLDANSGQWSICPVLQPSNIAQPASTVTPDVSSHSISSTSTSAGNIKRQDEGTIGLTASPLSSASGTSSLGQATASPVASGTPHNATFTVDGYTCSVGADAAFLISILKGMLDFTATNIDAQFSIVTLNLHSSSQEDSDSPVDPTTPTTLSSLIRDDFSSWMYTPSMLLEERKDINATWLDPESGFPIPFNYYTLQKNGDGSLSTTDGWPTQQFLQYEKRGLRILFTFGSSNLDQGVSYDTSKDADVIFPNGYLQNTVSFDGTRCAITLSNTELSKSNTSWAVASDPGNSRYTSKSAGVATNCGISFFLNKTDETDEPMNVSTYYDFLEASVWSWDKDEPTDVPRDGTKDEGQTFRCASMGTNGKWRVDDCGTKYRVACRVEEEPYSWAISSKPGSYMDAHTLCPSNASFGVPRSALQNKFLLEKLKSHGGFSQSSRLWVDFNSISVPSCWVSGSANATCPYSKEQRNSRYIVIPTLAAVIVLILFCLFLFVKFANKNFRKNRKRRKKERKRYAGHDYEGVPS